MKRTIALLLALVMVFALAACGNKTATESPAPDDDNKEPTTITNADDIPDEMTSEDGTYEVAFVTDVGQLKDKSFNEGTYNGVKLFAANNNKSYKYYQPANGSEATDDDRFNSMKAAVDNGATVVVCAGFLQENALRQAAIAYPDTQFIFIDGYEIHEDANDNSSEILTNIAGVAFQEEQCGYLAGYAAVMEGYTKLGFCGGGGGTNEACNRYGYGYVQGAEAAAAEKDVQVEMNFTWLYGTNFQPSAELQTLASGWYTSGTEVIFSCGGSIFDSITNAASANDAAVIGVDVDQSYSSDTVITSALKGIGEAAQLVLEAAYSGDWATYGGVRTTLGAKEGAVGLPTDTWSLENWTVEQYEEMFQKIVDGTIVVDNDFTKQASTAHVTLNVVE